MKTIYLNRSFMPVVVKTVVPGDIHIDPVFGDCRRMTAKRFCLASERAGKESDALHELLKAVLEAAENDVYDGRAVKDWFGLVGLSPPEPPPPQPASLEEVICPKCHCHHWTLFENGKVWQNGVCGRCWSKNFYPCPAS